MAKKESGWSEKDRASLWKDYKPYKDLAKLKKGSQEYKDALDRAKSRFNKTYPIKGSLNAKAHAATNGGTSLPGYPGRGLYDKLKKKKKEEEEIKKNI